MPGRGTAGGYRGSSGFKGGVQRHRRVKEHRRVPCQPIGSKLCSPGVSLQGAALAPGQKIRQPVEDRTQRQAGGFALAPIDPAGPGAYIAFYSDLCPAAGVLGIAPR